MAITRAPSESGRTTSNISSVSSPSSRSAIPRTSQSPYSIPSVVVNRADPPSRVDQLVAQAIVRDEILRSGRTTPVDEAFRERMEGHIERALSHSQERPYERLEPRERSDHREGFDRHECFDCHECSSRREHSSYHERSDHRGHSNHRETPSRREQSSRRETSSRREPSVTRAAYHQHHETVTAALSTELELDVARLQLSSHGHQSDDSGKNLYGLLRCT